MAGKIVGVAIPATNTDTVLNGIKMADELGVKAAWMTSGGNAGDPLTAFAVAASQTSNILLGTSILRTWSRHPVTVARQVQTIAGVAPERFRLGIGPSHVNSMVQTYGVDFRAPLGHLTEYIQILKALFQTGSVDYEGKHYSANFSMDAPIDVPVMASALRPKSFELCGAEADGAISWVCPHMYMREAAFPALKAGAEKAGRPVPPLIVHTPICVNEDLEAARKGVREQLGYFPSTPFYARMFATAGFASSETTGWTDEMLDSVLLAGDEESVARKLDEIFEWGASEVLASVITVGDADSSRERTMKLFAEYSSS